MKKVLGVCLVASTLLLPVAVGAESLPPGAVFPPRNPDTAGVVGVYAQQIAMEMMICGLRSQHYADIISDASTQLYFQLPPDQQAAAFRLVHANGGDVPDSRAMGLPSCQGYLQDNKFTRLINSMDHFVTVVNNQ